MVQLLRFYDLRARKIVNNRASLRNRIERDGFPAGRMIGRNARAWTEPEVDDWVMSRPSAGPAARGAAKAKADRKRAGKAAVERTGPIE
jgi:predicted DNA-binding transcriptional regulator AlpA